MAASILTTYQSSDEQDKQSLLFMGSRLMFRIGLSLVTFEQVRPFFDMQVSDYCFFLALLLFLSRPTLRLKESKGSGIIIPSLLVLSGAFLSLLNASSIDNAMGPVSKLLVLFALFAPLAIVHSKDIRTNMLFIAGGIFLNCVIALVEAWIFPGIVDVLSINPTRPDISASGRLQALTSHPNILGLSATVAVVISLTFLSFEWSKQLR